MRVQQVPTDSFMAVAMITETGAGHILADRATPNAENVASRAETRDVQRPMPPKPDNTLPSDTGPQPG